MAQSWADGCNFDYRRDYDPLDWGFTSTGENIWEWPDKNQTIPDKAIQDWYDEKKYYLYETGQCRGLCAHYIAVCSINAHWSFLLSFTVRAAQRSVARVVLFPAVSVCDFVCLSVCLSTR